MFIARLGIFTMYFSLFFHRNAAYFAYIHIHAHVFLVFSFTAPASFQHFCFSCCDSVWFSDIYVSRECEWWYLCRSYVNTIQWKKKMFERINILTLLLVCIFFFFLVQNIRRICLWNITILWGNVVSCAVHRRQWFDSFNRLPYNHIASVAASLKNKWQIRYFNKI